MTQDQFMRQAAIETMDALVTIGKHIRLTEDDSYGMREAFRKMINNDRELTEQENRAAAQSPKDQA